MGKSSIFVTYAFLQEQTIVLYIKDFDLYCICGIKKYDSTNALF
jgi:hypothetical protein